MHIKIGSRIHLYTPRAWLKGVLPLVMDKETTIQEKCIETVEEIILDNIVKKAR